MRVIFWDKADIIPEIGSNKLLPDEYFVCKRQLHGRLRNIMTNQYPSSLIMLSISVTSASPLSFDAAIMIALSTRTYNM